MIEDIIKEISNSDTFAKVIEIGAGVGVSHLIYQYSGASKTIYSVESPYSREAFEIKFGKDEHRSVSCEKLKFINDNTQIQTELKLGYYNTLLSSTFQVGNESNSMSTHGWFSLNIKGKSKYYHVSIHDTLTRIEYQNIIGEIGVRILHGKNTNIFEDSNIDIVLNDDLSYDKYTTLNIIQNDIYGCSVFKKDETVDRIESITRDVENLIIYKGSFNPPTLAHVEIADLANIKYNTNTVFSISINTFQKGIQNIESVLDRIKMINMLGFDVLIVNTPFFKDSVEILRNKYVGRLIYPIGVDTINRLALDYTNNVEQFKIDFDNVKFLCNLRSGYDFNDISKLLLSNDHIDVSEIENSSISSTMVRNGGVEEIEKYTPKQIQEFLKNK